MSFIRVCNMVESLEACKAVTDDSFHLLSGRQGLVY